jgi:hypothetical protein
VFDGKCYAQDLEVKHDVTVTLAIVFGHTLTILAQYIPLPTGTDYVQSSGQATCLQVE